MLTICTNGINCIMQTDMFFAFRGFHERIKIAIVVLLISDCDIVQFPSFLCHMMLSTVKLNVTGTDKTKLPILAFCVVEFS